MTRARLAKLQQQLDNMRKRLGSIKPQELVAIAQALGRKRFDRGKEPTYIGPRGFPISIPGHPGTLKKGTALNIINSLEADVATFEAELDEISNQAIDSDQEKSLEQQTDENEE